MPQHSKKALRYGGVTAFMTVLVVVLAILANTILTTLATRYEWFIDMNPTLDYPMSDSGFAYLDTYVIPTARASGEKIEIIFCNEEDAIKASATQKLVYDTVTELAAAYPDVIDIQYLNIWEQPSIARGYGIQSASAVVVKHREAFRTCSPRDFFVFDTTDDTTPVAYAGERRLAIAMKSVVDNHIPVCYLTLNHGESFPDDALMQTLVDAGYTVNFLDAVSFDIPDDCALLVTFNPSQDFAVTDSVSGISEIDRLNEYMARGGRHMVFASADTFAAGSFDNLEAYLSAWGVVFEHEAGAGGVEACYSIKDPHHALTVDGYTILGRIPTAGRGATLMANVRDTVRVANATGIAIADGFTANGSGDYVSGDRTVTPLLTSFAGAEAWVSGRAVDRTEDGYTLVTMTDDTATGAHLMVAASVDIASKDSLDTVAYDNATFLLSAIEGMGKDDIPVTLFARPFADESIHILTTSDARTLTLVLTVLPAVAVGVVGLVILIRRKRA